jgi:hypothetical protein
VTLPEVVTGDLAGKFGKISLYNQHADFEFGSASNSTSPWAIVCESTTQPSCADSPLHEHFAYGFCNASKAHAKTLSAPGQEGYRLRVQLGLQHRPRLELGLQPRLRLLFRLLLRVRLRVGPGRARVREPHD